MRYQRIFDNMSEFHSIKEAVIHVDKYLKVLVDIFESMFSDIPFNKNIEKILLILNEKFKSFNISFELKDLSIKGKNGIKKATYFSKDESIVVYVDNDIDIHFDSKYLFFKFVETCRLALSHELVHRGQYIQIKKHSHINKDINFLGKDISYYKDKHEIMAFANLIIEELRFNGYDNDDILKGIQTESFSIEDSEFLIFFQKNFKNYTDILNLLYKYIYMYLKEPVKVEL